MENNFKWATEATRAFMHNGDTYLDKNETVESRAWDIAQTLEKYNKIEGFAKEFYDNLEHYCLSTPFWTNVGKPNALPFSCFNTDIQDNMGSILYALGEVGMMTKVGGGTSGKINGVREAGASIGGTGISTGTIPLAEKFQDITTYITQNGKRRGYMAMYWDVFHPEIMEILEFRREHNKIQDLAYGVCIPDWWINEMKGGDQDKQEVWAKVLESRMFTGFPYLFFTDNVNNNRPDVYVDNGLFVQSSNLCTEITEVSDEKYSFLCDLAAMDLNTYSQWKDNPRVVEVLVIALDTLHTIFQEILEGWRDSEDVELNLRFDFLKKTYRSSVDFRDIGVGTIGYHDILQRRMIPFESMEAKYLNVEIYKTLKQQVDKASENLATTMGEPKMLEGYGRRNNLKIAIAPNTSSAFIKNQHSQSIELRFSNYYVKDISNIKHVVKNPHLVKLLEEKGKNTAAVWSAILRDNGSVQNLDFLSQYEKDVFKTSSEVSPYEVLIQASARQKYIDQAQSINLMLHPDTPLKEINKIHLFAWENGIKTLYYIHQTNASQEYRRSLMQCVSCEG